MLAERLERGENVSGGKETEASTAAAAPAMAQAPREQRRRRAASAGSGGGSESPGASGCEPLLRLVEAGVLQPGANRLWVVSCAPGGEERVVAKADIEADDEQFCLDGKHATLLDWLASLPGFGAAGSWSEVSYRPGGGASWEWTGKGSGRMPLSLLRRTSCHTEAQQRLFDACVGRALQATPALVPGAAAASAAPARAPAAAAAPAGAPKRDQATPRAPGGAAPRPPLCRPLSDLLSQGILQPGPRRLWVTSSRAVTDVVATADILADTGAGGLVIDGAFASLHE